MIWVWLMIAMTYDGPYTFQVFGRRPSMREIESVLDRIKDYDSQFDGLLRSIEERMTPETISICLKNGQWGTEVHLSRQEVQMDGDA